MKKNLLSAVLALPAFPVAAQQADPPPTAPKEYVYVESQRPGSPESGYRVDAPYSLGPLGTMKLLDAPYVMQIVPGPLLENTQVRSVKESLKYIPAAQFQEQQGSEVIRPATRGMQSSNFQNTRQNGMTIFVTGGNAIEEYEQIEVLAGPASAVFGPANPAGNFNFLTKRATMGQLTRASVYFDSRSILTGHADLGGRVGASEAVGYRLNALKANGESYAPDSELDRELLSLAVDVHPARDTTFELTWSDYNIKQKGYAGWVTYGPGINLPDAPDPTRRGYGQTYAGVELHNKTADARWKQDFGANWHLVVGGLYQRVDRNINTQVMNLVNNNGDYVASLGAGFAPRFGITSNIGYLNGTFRTGSVAHEVTFGTTGYRADSWAVRVPASPASILLGSANIKDPKVFPEPAAGLPSTGDDFLSSVATQQGVNATDQMQLTRQWALRLAVSYDWIGTRNFAVSGAQTTSYADAGLSPMPSIIYKPAENQTAYVTYASSLQQGDLAPAGSANANQGLAPYRSKQWEAGYKIALARGLDLSTAIFRLERPFANVDPADNVFKISGQQVNRGIEVLGIGQVAPGWRLYGGVTFIDAKMEDTGVAATDGKRYVGVPKVHSNFLVEYDVAAVPGLTGVFDWQYNSNRAANDTNTTFAPSYNTFDLGARYRAHLWGRNTTWRAAVQNLADERYWSSVNPSNITGVNKGNMVAHIGAPRTFSASVTVDF